MMYYPAFADLSVWLRRGILFPVRILLIPVIAGISYEIGRRSDLFFELAYHNSAPSWQFNVKDASTGRTKVFERKFDMSGMLMRVGVKFYF